jgi:hypothetical protein
MSIIAAALVFVLTACATSVVVGPGQTIKLGQKTIAADGLEGFNALVVKPPNPNGPNVFVINNYIVVDQEPVRPNASQGQVIIIWRLDSSESSPYFFPDDDAIKLQAGDSNPLPSDLACGAVGSKKRAFVCAYTKPESARQWKYRVRVKNGAGTDPTPLDPWVHQS